MHNSVRQNPQYCYSEEVHYCAIDGIGLASLQHFLLQAECPRLYTEKNQISDSSPIVPDAASRYFDNYLKCLRKAPMPGKHRRWYVKRVEEFIKAQNRHKIKFTEIRTDYAISN